MNVAIEAAEDKYLYFLNSVDRRNGDEALGNFVNAPEFKAILFMGITSSKMEVSSFQMS
jgi:hypothetical protein